MRRHLENSGTKRTKRTKLVGGFKLVTWGSIIRKFLSAVFNSTRPFNFTVDDSKALLRWL